MVTSCADTGAVVELGGSIVAMAGGVEDVVADVAGAPNVGDPPSTAGALVDFLVAYKRTTKLLRNDVLALGRLTQAAGTEYDAVEAAAARVDLAQGAPAPPHVPGGDGMQGSERGPRHAPPPPAGPFGPIDRVHPLHDLGVRNG